MKAMYLSILALASLSMSSPAEILIYKGTVKAVAEPGSGFPALANVYVMADLNTKQLSSVTYYVENGVKKINAGAPGAEGGARTASIVLPNGKQGMLFSFLFDDGNNSQDFIHGSLLLVGATKSLKAGSSGGGLTVSAPRTMHGSTTTAQAIAGNAYLHTFKFSLVYHGARTTAANDASQTNRASQRRADRRIPLQGIPVLIVESNGLQSPIRVSHQPRMAGPSSLYGVQSISGFLRYENRQIPTPFPCP
jgi:hypothetical protein